MSMLSVQRNTQVKCTNNPVYHCDWQNKTRWLELTCPTHVSMYFLALLTHLSSHIPFPNLSSHFQYFSLLDLISGEELITQHNSPLAFPSLHRPQRSSWIWEGFGWLFEPAFQAQWLQPCSQSLGGEKLCRQPSPTSQPRQYLNRAQDRTFTKMPAGVQELLVCLLIQQTCIFLTQLTQELVFQRGRTSYHCQRQCLTCVWIMKTGKVLMVKIREHIHAHAPWNW